ncbi:MAG: hypothetical protein ABEJ90_01690 [Halobacterium sp.]
MPDGLWDALEAEAEEQNRSTAEHIRAILRSHIEADTQSNTQADTQADTQAITDRLDDLEERLAHLEAANIERTREEMDVSVVSDTDATQRAESRAERAGREDDANPSAEAAEGGGEAPDDVAARVREHIGDGPPRKAHAREAVVRAVAYLAEAGGPVETSELKELLWEEFGEHYSTKRTMWNSVDRYLEEMPGVTKPGYGTWGFDAGDDADVYDPTEEFTRG